MKINRSDKPDYSLVRDWFRRELYKSKEFKVWMYNKIIRELTK